MPKPSIVEIAVNDGRFKTLVAALKKAGLVDTLSGKGPFTVFAPSDSAFDEFLEDKGMTAQQLLARRSRKYSVLSCNRWKENHVWAISRGSDEGTSYSTNCYFSK